MMTKRRWDQNTDKWKHKTVTFVHNKIVKPTGDKILEQLPSAERFHKYFWNEFFIFIFFANLNIQVSNSYIQVTNWYIQVSKKNSFYFYNSNIQVIRKNCLVTWIFELLTWIYQLVKIKKTCIVKLAKIK